MADFPASHVSLRGEGITPALGRSLVRIFVQERFALLPPCHTILALQALHRALVIGQGAWFNGHRGVGVFEDWGVKMTNIWKKPPL